MHWFKEILICAFLAEFITCMLFIISKVSDEMAMGRVILWMWLPIMAVFIVWYLLIYDKENDRLRRTN